MSADRWERLSDLYHAAAALAEDERSAFLREECADDPALQADVERLVAAHERASPIEPPAPGDPSLSDDTPAQPTEADGDDDTPVDFVGVPIGTYANEHRLAIGERLQLFLQACNAVSFSHQRKIVHGELNSETVVVTGDGIARLTGFTNDPHATPAEDISALGALLDQLLTGDATDRTRRQLPGELELVIRTALRRDPGKHYDSVDELADAIRRQAKRPSRQSRRDAANAPRSRKTSAIVAWTLAAGAVALLGVSVASLRSRRAEVVAPVVATVEPVVTRERVSIGAFVDRTGDQPLVAALSDAFRTGLAESPSIIVVSTRQRSAKTIVTTSVDTTAGGYTLGARITNAETGAQIATLTETALDSADVVLALGRLSTRLREQLGESQASIAGTPSLDEVSTASLAALRQFAAAGAAIDRGDRASAVKLLKSATTLDTGFAAAHRLMANAYGDLGDRTRSADALDHALANQARLPFYERYQTVGTHAGNVVEDYATAIDAYNHILERYPNDFLALTNLAAVHAARREYVVQDSLLVRAAAVDPNVASVYSNIAMARLNHGKYDEARRVLDDVERRFPGLRATQLGGIAIAAAKQNWDDAERDARQRASAAGDSTDGADGLETLASIVMTQGRLSEAEQNLRRVLARVKTPRRYMTAALRLAYLELRYRHAPNTAIATMNAALTKYPFDRMQDGDRLYDEVARLYADAGRPGRARELIAQAARTRLGRQRGVDANRRWTLGAIAMAEEQPWQGEIEIRVAADGHPCPICALPDLARAYEVAGKADSAIATYERYINSPWQRRYETDGTELGFAMKQLGELYQRQNDRVRSATHYKALLQLWRNADAELEPLVSDVKRRLDETGDVATR
jgi:tetratricopeptide (TPR) repeat protein